MKRLILAAAVAALASPASATDRYDYWNRSGFSLDHNFHSPFDNMFRGYQSYRPAYPVAPAPAPSMNSTEQLPASLFETDRAEFEVWSGGSEATAKRMAAEARAKAIAGERTCAPVKMYTDEGVIYHAALGCR